jgi:phosphatidylserine synthase
MVLSPAILSLALDAKGVSPSFATFLQNPWTGVFMLLFVGTLMASRLPTISLKAVRVSRQWMPLVLAGLLLLIALLASNFWLTLGILGIGYILTVPVSGFVFLRVRARFEAESGGEREASVSE